jgi:hypothetical protein
LIERVDGSVELVRYDPLIRRDATILPDFEVIPSTASSAEAAVPAASMHATRVPSQELETRHSVVTQP